MLHCRNQQRKAWEEERTIWTGDNRITWWRVKTWALYRVETLIPSGMLHEYSRECPNQMVAHAIPQHWRDLVLVPSIAQVDPCHNVLSCQHCLHHLQLSLLHSFLYYNITSIQQSLPASTWKEPISQAVWSGTSNKSRVGEIWCVLEILSICIVSFLFFS
jgi:hypothetical protein